MNLEGWKPKLQSCSRGNCVFGGEGCQPVHKIYESDLVISQAVHDPVDKFYGCVLALYLSVLILRGRLANQEKFFSVAENKFIETLCEILDFFVDALPFFFRGNSMAQ